MTIDNESIKDKIRKLMTLANDPGAFEGETENCLRMMRKLMIKHNIKEEDIKQEGPEQVSFCKMDVYTFGRDMARWEGSLLQTISTLVGTVQGYRNAGRTAKFLNTKTGKYHTRLTFYGPSADVRDAVEIYDEWSRIIIAMARLKTGSWVREGGRSYCEGFAAALWEKVKVIDKEEKVEVATGKSLVLFNALAQMALVRKQGTDWLQKEMKVRIRTSRAHSNRSDDPEAYQRGKADGSNADFKHSTNQKLT